MNTNKFHPIILSGGAGTRLWPLSRWNLPKPYMDIGKKNLFDMTISRLIKYGHPVCVSTRGLYSLTLKAFRKHGIAEKNIWLEPEGKNTAPAVALLCKRFIQNNQSDAVVGIFPADHHIGDLESFHKCIDLAIESAKNGGIVTLGMAALSPKTEYGYIQLENRVEGPDINRKVFPVTAFKEKPKLEDAQKFVDSGKYFWNSGIFIFKVSVVAELFEKHLPKLWQSLGKLSENQSNLAEIYKNIEAVGFDKGILEKINTTLCIPSSFSWSDVGSWDEFVKTFDAGADFHVVSNQNKTYKFLGMRDFIVVDTKDALLVMKKGMSAEVAGLVDQLKTEKPDALLSTQYEERPWGNFEVLKDEGHYKTKVLTIEPGQQISYQSHEKRSEHWIIVKGSPEIIVDDVVSKHAVGDHIFIPKKAKHTIKNQTKENIEIVEVQLGEYFGEDDIKRYQDIYNRSGK